MTRAYPETSTDRKDLLLLQNVASYMLLAYGLLYVVSGVLCIGHLKCARQKKNVSADQAIKDLQVHEAVTGLQDSAASRTSKLQQEMSTMQEPTSSVNVEWSSYIDKAETQYCEDTAAVESGKKDFEVLQKWYTS